MIVYAIHNKKKGGFLKGNGAATHLRWNMAIYTASFFKRREGAQKIVDKINRRRGGDTAEIFEVEMVLHGTISDILEKEVLSED